MSRKFISIWAIIFSTVIVDQITKWLAVWYLKDQSDITALWGVFRLTYAENTGAFLSFGSQLPDYLRFHIFTVGVAIFLVFVYRHLIRSELNALQTYSLAFLIGGGIGNLIDRAFYSYVIDFLFIGYHSVRTGVFNVADMAILFAVLAMLFEPLLLKMYGTEKTVSKTDT